MLKKPAFTQTLTIFTFVFTLFFINILFCSSAKAETYYVNNQPGSNCINSGLGTSGTSPWCDFTPINNHGAFQPGDQIFLARGATWNQEMDLIGSGTSTNWITLDAYGSGSIPKIIRNGNEADRALRLNNPSYWNINNIEVGSAGTGILVYFTTLYHQGLHFDNIFAHDIHGIHQGDTTSGQNDKIWNSAGIEITGSVGSFSNTDYALSDVKIENMEGTHNQDSISFDWFNGVTSSDGGDWHNLVQNVVLNQLYLHNDNGPDGCDESLRLVNMMNVTMMNSILDGEAGCYSCFFAIMSV